MFDRDPPALFATGRVACWGGSSHGQLGRNSLVPTGYAGAMSLLDYISFSDTLSAVQLSMLSASVCALFENGRVRCWGRNSSEELGDGTQINRGESTGVSSVTSAVFVTFGTTLPILSVTTGA